jgi:arylsulfatase A-like enzyme
MAEHGKSKRNTTGTGTGTGNGFGGVIRLDIRDSKANWDDFLAKKAPPGAPNVLVVLYDDTGLAAWSPYGGRINMPTLQRLADRGLIYTQWHTTALCAPTRSCFLTGRNHHQNGCATIAEMASGFPGASSHTPPECAPMATILRDAGWSTFWVGKNHNVPVDEWTMGASKKRWPLAMGYDRFYGFIGGETNQWYPDLAEDNHYIEQPYGPEDGYHLSRDLADKALAFIRDSKQTEPDKPWYLWFCPGANHAPHHAPKEYVERYKGMFDDGYEAYREWVLGRMIEKDILPRGTELTPINPMSAGTFVELDAVRPWATLSPDEQRLFSRMAEVYAGMSEYTDAQVGRIIDYLEQSGQLENTLVMYCADNGASGEGTPNGSVNEGKFANAYPDDIAQNLAMIDKLGTPDTYNHYPTGWAVAFSTPFRMFKRYSYQGGVADPLVVSWPCGMQARGGIRHQYHHCTDIVPTILDCCGVAMPAVVDGVQQVPLPGVSMRYTFDEPDAPTRKETQYYEMLGTRAIWHKGWKAVAEHGPLTGIGHFDEDRWQLFHTDEDRAEANDLALQQPELLDGLVKLWLSEAEKYNVLPLNDYGIFDSLKMEFKAPVPKSGQYVYYPGTSEIPERSAANTHGVSFKVLAEVKLTPKSEGIIFAHGSRFGGHALFIKGHKLHYVYNFLGIPPIQRLIGVIPKSGAHVLGVEFTKQRLGQYKESFGIARLYVDHLVVNDAPFRTMSGHFAITGEGLCIGYDSGDAVSDDYRPRFAFTAGEIIKVVFDVGDDVYIDVAAHLTAAMARD